jgi:hypothetical protein
MAGEEGRGGNNTFSLSLSLSLFLGKCAADTKKNPTQIFNAEEDK